MRRMIRSLTLGLAATLAAAAMAQQPYTVLVGGLVQDCPSSSTVTIQTAPGTLPAQTVTVPITLNDPNVPNYSYSHSFHLDTSTGGFIASLSCGNGTAALDSTSYDASNEPYDSTACSIGVISCGGVIADPCQAAFTVQQTMNGNTPISWQITTTNTSTGVGPIDYTWWLPDGSMSNDANPGFTFSQPGIYGMCLTISADSGFCTSTVCDTIHVDSLGQISTDVWFDCLWELWGPHLPGTPCSDVMGNQGTWSADCVCVTGTTPESCQAGFYVIQAYTDSSSNPGGSSEPIPNEVWVWNLSTGGNGDVQYLWNFGDGTSSTDAYPTHEYDGPGPWDLCLTITAGNCTDTYCDSVSVDANGILNGMVIEGHPADQNHRTNGFTLNVLQSEPTGIAETPAIADLRLWPNPAQNELNLTFNNVLAGTVSVTVIDPSGRLVISEEHNLALGSNTLRLNTASLQPGLYMVRIGNDAHSLTHRFMKVN